MKHCFGCGETKPFVMFSNNSSTKDGFQSQCKDCGAARYEIAKNQNKCDMCQGPTSPRRTRCRVCTDNIKRETVTRHVTTDGYVKLTGFGWHPNAIKGHILEHRLVMSLDIDRALLPEEEVHHKNGNRIDNRLSNLELWSHSQPPGQRVTDKVEWAWEIIGLYDKENDMANSPAEDWLESVENLPAPKYSAVEVLNAITEFTEGDLDEFWYDTDQIALSVNGITEMTSVVEDFGGEGQGDARYVVFKLGEQFFRKEGYYTSYDGSTWDGDFFECFPVIREVTFYERNLNTKGGKK